MQVISFHRYVGLIVILLRLHPCTGSPNLPSLLDSSENDDITMKEQRVAPFKAVRHLDRYERNQ